MQPLRIDKAGSIRILQITDSHLGEDPGEKLTGVSTEQSFLDVLDLVIAQEMDYDLVLATGDIANHGTEAAYKRFVSHLNKLGKPWLWLPGNHDVPQLMNQVAPENSWERGLDLPHWQCQLLSTHVPREVGGELAQSEVNRLKKALADSAKHQMVLIHHQPLPVGSAWIDSQLVANGQELLDILTKADHAKALVWGHIHQEVDRDYQGLRLLATPSTCIQFKPVSDGFALDNAMPGYRWIELHADGSLTTGIERVPQKDYGVDFNSAGY